MTALPIVSASDWEAAHRQLRAKEKEATRARDALAAERRRQPMMEFPAGLRFDSPEGERTMLDLFEGRPQLILYTFMFKPGGEPCGGCSMFTDQVGHLAHINARDVTVALVSEAPQDEIAPFKERMGWDLPWYTSADRSYHDALGLGGGFELDVFLRDGDRVLRTYSTTSRGVEALGSVWTLLDLTPLGRQEEWEERGPAGGRETEPYVWWNLHDEYGAAVRG